MCWDRKTPHSQLENHSVNFCLVDALRSPKISLQKSELFGQILRAFDAERVLKEGTLSKTCDAVGSIDQCFLTEKKDFDLQRKHLPHCTSGIWPLTPGNSIFLPTATVQL